MPRFRLEIARSKCRSFGKCMVVAPEVFAFDKAGKVRLVEGGTAPEDALVKAAKSCPYRVITVVDDETGRPIFPPGRTLTP